MQRFRYTHMFLHLNVLQFHQVSAVVWFICCMPGFFIQVAFHMFYIGFIMPGGTNHAVARGFIPNSHFTALMLMQNEYGLGK